MSKKTFPLASSKTETKTETETEIKPEPSTTTEKDKEAVVQAIYSKWMELDKDFKSGRLDLDDYIAELEECKRMFERVGSVVSLRYANLIKNQIEARKRLEKEKGRYYPSPQVEVKTEPKKDKPQTSKDWFFSNHTEE